MRDGYDWSVLQRSSDPTPGDPGVVLAGGEQYLEVADAISRTVTHLRGLDAGTVHISQAVEAFMENAREVADTIERAELRYRETGQALKDYAPQLATAQEETLAAWSLASSSRSDQEAAEGNRSYYLSLAGDSTDPEQAIQYENLADDAGQDAHAAAGRIALALEQTAEAVALYGNKAGPTGASFRNTSPSTMNGLHREMLGLPDVNSAERLIVARLDDPSQIVLQRHALPLDGMPGGAPEYIIPGPNQSGITVLQDTVFRLP